MQHFVMQQGSCQDQPAAAVDGIVMLPLNGIVMLPLDGIAALPLDGIAESGCQNRSADSIINDVWAALPHRLLSIDGGIV